MHDRKDVVLPEPPAELRSQLDAATARSDEDEQRRAVGELVASAPTFLEGWAELARLGREPIERYAYARVGYHRGLDALRRNGWGGTGLVRWEHPTNRGFLRCVAELHRAAAEIGEQEEVDRLAGFLVELDPDWDDHNA
ncbi:MAG: DUF3151 domain-containing protein [Actinobacteria bacterium]|nr:DUF3151 domain-containing protein [Actinomycetota bacterium]